MFSCSVVIGSGSRGSEESNDVGLPWTVVSNGIDWFCSKSAFGCFDERFAALGDVLCGADVVRGIWVTDVVMGVISGFCFKDDIVPFNGDDVFFGGEFDSEAGGLSDAAGNGFVTFVGETVGF